MACRLNPDFKRGLTDFGLFILIAVATFGIFAIYCAICISIPYYFSMWTDSYAWLANFSSSHRTYSTLSDYVFYCSATAVGLTHLALAIVAFFGTISYSFIREIIESYQVKRHQSAFKFQGKPLPWYRILISYIIICDKQ